jgi:hypothetical protein
VRQRSDGVDAIPSVPVGPTGNGNVELQFGNDGQVQSAQLLNVRFLDIRDLLGWHASEETLVCWRAASCAN